MTEEVPELLANLLYGVESEEDLDQALDPLRDIAATGDRAAQVLAARGLLILVEAGPPSWKVRSTADAWMTSFCDDARSVLATWRHRPVQSSTMSPE